MIAVLETTLTKEIAVLAILKKTSAAGRTGRRVSTLYNLKKVTQKRQKLLIVNEFAGKNVWERLPAKNFANPPYSQIPKNNSKGQTKGYFMIVNTDKGNPNNEPSRLVSPVIGGTSLTCEMTLAYHMTQAPNAEHPPTLSIFLLELTNTGGMNQKWLYTTDTIATKWTPITVRLPHLSAGTQILITAANPVALTNNVPYADIEIDNIRFNYCEDHANTGTFKLNCSFEGIKFLTLILQKLIFWRISYKKHSKQYN